MNLEFICGCKTGNVESEENLKTMDAVVEDDEGMLVCAIHHQRRYGWKTLPVDAMGRVVWSFASWTAREIERFLLFGEVAKFAVANVSTSIGDARDNSDPEIVGQKYLSYCTGSVEARVKRATL